MSRPSLKKKSATDWSRVDALRDEDIDFSDIPEQDAAFFKNAVLKMPQPKVAVTIRLDQDVLTWFKAQGKGYQTRINALLRAFKEARSKA
jgi:uncharacterized protein (DUF4415 family)